MMRAIAVLLLAVCGSETKAQRSKVVNPGGLAAAVAKYPITFGIENPAELLGMLLVCLGPRLQRDELARALRIVDEEMTQELGVALSKPMTWLKTGIDPSKPIRMSVLGFGGWFNLPNVILFSAATRRQEAFMRFLGEQVKGELRPAEGKPAVYLFEGTREAIGFLGGRLSLVSGPSEEKVEDFLRGVLSDQGRARTISTDLVFDLVKRSGPDSFPLALFLNFVTFERIRSAGVTLPDSLFMAIGSSGLVAGAPLATDSELLTLKMGVDSRKFLARFDQPTFAFSASLADPMLGLRTALAEFLPVGLPDLDQVIGRLPDRLGIDVDSLAQQVKNGSGGMLFYPGPEGERDPSLVAFLHLQDPASMIEVLSTEIPRGGVTLEPHRQAEGQYLLRAPDGHSEFVLGVIDGYLLLSNSLRHVDRMVKGEASSWQPRIGGQQLLAAELNPIGITALLTQSRMDPLIPFVGKLQLFGQLEIKPKGLLVRIEPFGDRSGREMVGDFLEACLFAIAGEIAPQEPEFVFELLDAPAAKEKKK